MNPRSAYEAVFNRIENAYRSFATRVALIVGDLEPGQVGIRLIEAEQSELFTTVREQLAEGHELHAADRDEVAEILARPDPTMSAGDATTLLYRQTAVTRELDAASDAHGRWRELITAALEVGNTVDLQVLVDLHRSVARDLGVHALIHDADLVRRARDATATGERATVVEHKTFLADVVEPALKRVTDTWMERAHKIAMDEGTDTMAGAFLLEPTAPVYFGADVLRRPTMTEMRQRLNRRYGEPAPARGAQG